MAAGPVRAATPHAPLTWQERGLLDRLPDWAVSKPYDPETSLLDEALMYALAAAGFAFQIATLFTLPFPLDLVCLPLTLVEWLLEVQIAWGLTTSTQ